MKLKCEHYYPSVYEKDYNNLQKIRWAKESDRDARTYFDIPIGSEPYLTKNDYELIAPAKTFTDYEDFNRTYVGLEVSPSFCEEILGERFFYFLCCLYSETLLGQLIHSEYRYSELPRPNGSIVHELNLGLRLNPRPKFVFYIHDAFLSYQINNKQLNIKNLLLIFQYLSENVCLHLLNPFHSIKKNEITSEINNSILILDKSQKAKIDNLFLEHNQEIMQYLQNIENNNPTKVL